jgi:hemolysin activation/secretion protein
MLRIGVLCVLSCFALPDCVHAADTSLSTGEALIQQEQQRQESLRREREATDAPFTVIPRGQLTPNAPPADSGPCFDIQTIAVEGVEAFSASRIAEIYSPFLNRCLAANDINGLIRSLTNLYLDAGYITSRAYLPNQNLTQGHLRLVVVEGFVESVAIEGASHKRLRSAFPGIEGKKLNLRTIEQGIDAIGRSGAEAKVDFLPGSILGATRLVVKVKNRPQRQFTLGVDNEGSKATGRTRVSLTQAWNNPIGFNDLAWLNVQTTALGRDDRRKATSLAASYSIPWGNWVETLSVNQYQYESWVSEAVVPFATSGDSSSISLDSRYLLWRDQTGLTHLGLRLKQQDTENLVSDVRLITSSRRYSAASAYASSRHVGQRQEWQTELALHHGLSSDQAELGGATPEAKFNKWTLDASYLKRSQWQQLPLEWRSQWQFQHSDDLLYASEQLSLGGQYTVRGFAEQSVQGTSGFFTRNSLSTIRPGRLDSAGFWQPSIALDYGQLRTGESLSGAALGLSYTGNQLQLQLEIGKALRTGSLQEEGFITQGSMSLSWRW